MSHISQNSESKIKSLIPNAKGNHIKQGWTFDCAIVTPMFTFFNLSFPQTRLVSVNWSATFNPSTDYYLSSSSEDMEIYKYTTLNKKFQEVLIILIM